MAVPSTSFLIAVLVIFYLFSFVLFAVIRIATGVSIQRLGYFSLRRISYTIRDGLRIEVHTLGLYLHRPTFAKPTWISLRLSDLRIIIDIESLGKKSQSKDVVDKPNDLPERPSKDTGPSAPEGPGFSTGGEASWSDLWKRLTAIKEKIKAVHDKIEWLRMFDVEILNSSCSILGVASVQVASISAAVDTRRKTVDRGRLFRHKKPSAREQQPVEWMFGLKGVLFTADGKDSLEILDTCTLNVHGFLYKRVLGLRDASISLKLGRIHIPYDDVLHCCRTANHKFGVVKTLPQAKAPDQELGGLQIAKHRDEELTHTLTEFRSFVSSILRGIQEIQLAISFIGLSTAVRAKRLSTNPLFVNFTMNEFGIDLFRLDPHGPAHRMYFALNDVAHQALLAAISIGVSMDDGSGEPQRLLYIPMATTTIKTTLPTRTITETLSKDAADRNANILFANLVVTSPSLDMDLKHLALVTALVDDRQRLAAEGDTRKTNRTLSRLIPKTNVKISIQEPVARIVLPPSEPRARDLNDYDLLISSISAISLEVESSHTASGDDHYSLDSNLRISSHKLYYQAASGVKHSLLFMDAFEARLHLTATPLPSIALTGNLETFSIHVIRPEITEGLNQIVQQLSKSPYLDDKSSSQELSWRQNALSRCPQWLAYLHFRASRFEVEVGGTDPGVSQDLRGIAVQLQSWSLEYTCQNRSSEAYRAQIHSKTEHRTNTQADLKQTAGYFPTTADLDEKSSGRELILRSHGLEAFVVESPESWEPDPFLSMPKIEASMLTTGDGREQACHIGCDIQALFVHYSLYRYYVICIGLTELRRAFNVSNVAGDEVYEKYAMKTNDIAEQPRQSWDGMTIDVKVPFLQVKAAMPHDPAVMLQIYSLEWGQHRWSSPFIRSRLVRLYAQLSGIKAWVRLASIKTLRGDLRDSRRKLGQGGFVQDRSFDIVTEFIRLGVPHQLVLHKVFDNMINILKATEQLNHRFKTGTDAYILTKEPQQAKRVPRISLRSKVFMFEIEDGVFEWKLGLIYRVGLSEQKQRLAREDAFRVKVRKLQGQNQRRDSSRHGLHSHNHGFRGQSKPSDPPIVATATVDGNDGRHSQRSSVLPAHQRGRSMRYDADAVIGLTDSARIGADDAWLRLQEHNASSWRKRITSALRFQRNSVKDVRRIFWGKDESPSVDEDTETILSTPERPGLVTAVVSDLHIIVDRPSFPIESSSSFLHRVGKRMPISTECSLLIPMSLVVNLGETQITLRNYPLPLLHIPAIRPEQSSRLPSWSLKGDFVIAEEFRSEDSMRHVQVEVVPARKMSTAGLVSRFCIDVRRTVSPVKTFSDIDVAINTARSTSITWGTSYQPAIQDMMQIIESFTKPQADPSEPIGFWDKIRLLVHSRVKVAWKGGGDVQFRLKGSRDPYCVTGHGAGFVMCFRSDAKWEINQEDDPKKFMTVNCEEYILAIPDYSHQARESSTREATFGTNTGSTSPTSAYQDVAVFKKVIVKLKGRVRWLAGLVFERENTDGSRSFEFIPHYKVTLRTPHHAKSLNVQKYDAFDGFRSHYIHLSVAVIAPVDRDWSVTNSNASTTYNSMHMSPKFFTHFYDWWSLFSGIMSLPIRQGKLFPGREKSSKKFGRHLATIKYNLLLAPFFISHIYKHKDVEDYASDVVGATGLKLGLESFMLDLHQRREEFASQGTGRLKATRTSSMRINKVQLDFLSADIRAVSASIKGTAAEDLKRAPDADLNSYHDQAFLASDVEHFIIPDRNFDWIDMDDFVELDWILPAETHPQTRIMPLAFAPRFTYIRQTDHTGPTAQSRGRKSLFGDEPTHFCVMTADNDPQRVQRNLVQKRISVLREQLRSHNRLVAEQEAKTRTSDHKDSDRLRVLQQQREMIEKKLSFMQAMLGRILRHLQPNSTTSERSPSGTKDSSTGIDLLDDASDHEDVYHGAKPNDTADDFNNRFVIHNVQLKWNNSLRNVILRYVHQVSQRRGFVYYMSQRAVKFILDIVDEQQRNKSRTRATSPHDAATPASQPSPATSSNEDASSNLNLEERIRDLLNDGRNFVAADDPKPTKSPRRSSQATGNDLSEEYTPQNSYHLRLIAPQIQLQSEKNAKSVVLVTAREMQLKVVQIMDRTRLADDVSGLVQRRFSVDMDGVQFFVTNQKTINQFIHLYSANRYGSPQGSAWPSWAPVEVNFDFQLIPFGWSRVVQKTSASLRYDKYNTLRLKYNDEVNRDKNNRSSLAEDAESRIDHLWVDFPHIKAVCDSTEYYAMYVIVLDLLLYSEPLEKIRSERLEKIMLATDFSDLSGTPEMVTNLQERVRQLEDIKTHFQIHAKQLDRQGWQDRLAIERDLASCEDELFFIMKAITTSQRKPDERAPDSQTNGLLRWYLSASEIVWHLMRESDKPLMEIQLQHALYDRTDNSDSSNHNVMEIERIQGLNLLPDATYREMIAPYFEPGAKESAPREAIKMFKIQWIMMEAIAGIPVLDQFEVNLFPVKLQLEREVGKKLFEYVFPNDGDKTGASPFLLKHTAPQDDGDSDDAEESKMLTSPDDGDIYNPLLSASAASLELRLRPTTMLHSPRSPTSPTSTTFKVPNSETGRNRLTLNQGKGRGYPRLQSTPSLPSVLSSSRRKSGESLQTQERSVLEASSTNLSIATSGSERSKRFVLHRTNSDVEREKTSPTDELTEMMSRASNYMTLAYAKVPSVVLCLSYKGRGERNFEDLNNFVFRMPTLEYRNKTWSNLDLALRLKKDFIKALISHTGAIIGHKLHGRRSTKRQRSRVRDAAISSSLISNYTAITSTSNISLATSSLPRQDHLALTLDPPSTIAGSDLKNARIPEHDSNLDRMSSTDKLISLSLARRSDSNLPRTKPLPTTPSSSSLVAGLSLTQSFNPFTSHDDDKISMNQGRGVQLRRSSDDGSQMANPSRSGTGRGQNAMEDSEPKNRKPSGVLNFGKKILSSLNS